MVDLGLNRDQLDASDEIEAAHTSRSRQGVLLGVFLYLTFALLAQACAARHSDYMLTALLTVTGVLLAAAITAYATIRAKRVDLIGQIDQKRAEEVKRAYYMLLAGFDSVWHYRCHAILDKMGHSMPFEI